MEGLDAQLVNVVRSAKGQGAVPTMPQGGGWLMVEVGGATSEEAMAAAEKVVLVAGPVDAMVLPAGPEAKRLWQIRADGAGLAGRPASGGQAWPGWEDSAVPPENLGAYLPDLEALMQGEGLSGLAYGHFGNGCVHVRIDFPLEENAAVMRRFLEFLTSIGWEAPSSDERLLAQPHCHQYAVIGYDKDLALLDAMGCDVEVSSGCCGLAGNFGMEKGHYEVSVTIAEQGILAKARTDPDRAILADGFSCRTQVSDLAGRGSRHLVEVIADALDRDPAHEDA
ncbi:FAD-linked oxidase C-terminal domain-containing protein [Arthrobacter terrae]|uniref:FAD-linked oxidase C-terminal domain-containing protein n=1 Tax=Arthrobacter terrae TaxID=2935737 RepID=UPI00247A495B|nr:FAD-linked oxidase C-terminal domain-containing protein [Arthrobacter terrae]